MKYRIGPEQAVLKANWELAEKLMGRMRWLSHMAAQRVVTWYCSSKASRKTLARVGGLPPWWGVVQPRRRSSAEGMTAGGSG